jgi:hypothetical protein
MTELKARVSGLKTFCTARNFGGIWSEADINHREGL